MALLKKKEEKEIIVGLPGDEQIGPTLCFGGGAAALRDFRVGQPGALVPWVAPRGQQCDSFRFLFPFLRTVAYRRASFFKESKRRNYAGSRESCCFFRSETIKRHVWNAKCTLGMFFRHRCWSR